MLFQVAAEFSGSNGVLACKGEDGEWRKEQDRLILGLGRILSKAPDAFLTLLFAILGELGYNKGRQNETMEYSGEKTMHHREELKQEIEKKRKELSTMIDRQAEAEVLYRLSVELDQLIAQYMGH